VFVRTIAVLAWLLTAAAVVLTARGTPAGAFRTPVPPGAAGGGCAMSVTPQAPSVPVGVQSAFDVVISNCDNVAGAQAKVAFDAHITVDERAGPPGFPSPCGLVGSDSIDNAAHTVEYSCVRQPLSGVSGGGVFARYLFTCDSAGSVSLTLVVSKLTDAAVAPIAHATVGGALSCTACPDGDGDGLDDCSEAALGTDPDDRDTDGDGCPDGREVGPQEQDGGRRNPLNRWDYFNPTRDGQNRVDDIIAIVMHYGENAGDAGYTDEVDRTHLGPHTWNAGPPNGKIRVDDILAEVMQYNHDCA
jgi:hypothetical protein